MEDGREEIEERKEENEGDIMARLVFTVFNIAIYIFSHKKRVLLLRDLVVSSRSFPEKNKSISAPKLTVKEGEGKGERRGGKGRKE